MESPTYQSVHLERLLLQLKRKRFHLDLIKASTKKEKKSLILIARITVESCLADFVNLLDQIKFDRASVFGPSICISLEGYYAKATNKLNMQGVLSPLYVVNAIGSIFTRKGEGLLGFNYRLKGSADRPEVLVNPLSIFTPAIFREIFRRPVPNLE